MKSILAALFSFSLILNIYLYSRPELECTINKDELFSKVNLLNEDQLGDEYAGKLLLLLLAELGLKDEISLNSSFTSKSTCTPKIVEKVITKEVPKEIVKTIVKKQKNHQSFMNFKAMTFSRLLNSERRVDNLFNESYLSIFEDNQLSTIDEGIYVIEHIENNQRFETLKIEHSFIYKEKIWQGHFHSIIKREEKKVLSDLKTAGANSRIFSSQLYYNTLIWRQDDFMIALWTSKKEHARYNGIIYKKNEDGNYKKYGHLALQNY